MSLRLKNIVKLLFLLLPCSIVAQQKYWVFFEDKKESLRQFVEGDFLSQESIQRRIHQGIEIEQNDYPVSPSYLNEIKNKDIQVYHSSRWLNAISVEINSQEELEFLKQLDFVRKVQPVKQFVRDNVVQYNSTIDYSTNSYGPSFGQIAQINGHLLHTEGYKGNGKVIAVMDASFYKVNELSVFDSLWSNNRILDAWDFVLNQELDYTIDTIGSHGTMVLSCMGGYMVDSLIGTAPEASYLLYRTEDTSSETLAEEDNWVAAAEYADAFGADVINTSLGYSILWDDTLNSHTYEDMDGNTTIITIAADIAASKGMLVVNSAGNSGNNDWNYITAPADGDSVLTVGAVDVDSILTYFSSHGPTADGRMKPNVVAQGLNTVVCNLENGIRTLDGTSFSSPIIAGIAASAWSVMPEISSMELYRLIEESSHLYPNGDNDYGYGVPDFNQVLSHLKLNSNQRNNTQIYPNPFEQHLVVDLSLFDQNKEVEIQLINALGEIVFNKKVVPSKSCRIDFYELLPRGIYTLKGHQKSSTHYWRVVK